MFCNCFIKFLHGNDIWHTLIFNILRLVVTSVSLCQRIQSCLLQGTVICHTIASGDLFSASSGQTTFSSVRKYLVAKLMQDYCVQMMDYTEVQHMPHIIFIALTGLL